MPSYIEMPKLSDTMTEGSVVKWRKAVGDTVETGDVVAEIETDKAVMDLEAFEEGTLSEIFVSEGGKARIGERLARLASAEDASSPPHEHPTAEQGPVSSAKIASPAREPPPVELKPRAPATGRRPKASPLARKLAVAKQVNLEWVQGSGPGGRILARDVETAGTGETTTTVLKPGPVAMTTGMPAPSRPAVPSGSGDKRIPLSGMRRVIAERLLASKTQIPHFYLEIEVDTGALTRLRAETNAALEKVGQVKLTVNDFVLRACAMAAVRVPQVNATFAGNAIIEYTNVHLAVAVAVEEGLVTPVIREAQRKSLREISEEIKELANRARSKKLTPDEYQGGTITVSNLGNYGITRFSAIINPPQALIVSIGAIVKKPVLDARGQVVPGERMSVCLSADHRVVDGAIGARFLAEMRVLLENPTLLWM